MTNPRYQTVAELLRTKIAVEAHASGALPTEVEMCSEYGVSRSTMRKALGLLQRDGWIEARQGSGWSVPISRRGRQFGTFRLRATAHPATDANSSTIGHERRRPSVSVARSLNTDRRSTLLVVERLTRSGDAPIHRSETWFNPALSRTLDPVEATTEPPARLLASHGQVFGPFDQYAEAVLSDARDQQLLNIEDRTAVLQVVRTAYTTDGQPLFQSVHRHPGPAIRLDIDLPTTNQSDGLVVAIHRSSG